MINIIELRTNILYKSCIYKFYLNEIEKYININELLSIILLYI